MFHSLFRFHRLLALTFLVVFANASVGQCWCGPRVAPAAAAAGQANAVAPCGMSAAAMATHACCRGRAAAGLAAGKGQHRQHQSSGRHGCCKNKAAALRAALAAPAAAKHLASPAPAVLPIALALAFRPQAGPWGRRLAVRLLPPQPLPPKIPDIRIFIQSLTV